MDTLANCLYGMDISMQNNEKNTFFEQADQFLNDLDPNHPLFLINGNKNKCFISKYAF